MCSLHLTHPSVHTWSSGQPTVQRLGSSRGLPVGAGIQTHNLGLPRVSSPTLYPLGLYPLGQPDAFTIVTTTRVRLLLSIFVINSCRHSRLNLFKMLSEAHDINTTITATCSTHFVMLWALGLF